MLEKREVASYDEAMKALMTLEDSLLLVDDDSKRKACMMGAVLAVACTFNATHDRVKEDLESLCKRNASIS